MIRHFDEQKAIKKWFTYVTIYPHQRRKFDMKTHFTNNQKIVYSALILMLLFITPLALFAQSAKQEANDSPKNVSISSIPTGPEIAVMYSLNNITCTTGEYNFGNKKIGSYGSQGFTIRNSGNQNLNLTGSPYVTISGTHASDFSVTSQPTSPVAPSGASTNFTVKFTPSATGLRQATVSISNNDSDENPFTFTVKGTGVAYSGGSGTENDPWQIATKADLKTLSETSTDWASHFIQTADIEFAQSDFESGGDFYNSGAGFHHIGNDTVRFTGSYDGNEYTISNLFINRPTTDFIGLFGMVGKAEIKNLGVVDSDISGKNYVGGIIGTIGYPYILSVDSCIVTRCYSSGTVNGSGTYVGGIAGMSYTSTIENVYSLCSIEGTGNFFGGLIGHPMMDIKIQYCYAAGSVYKSTTSGGLFAQSYSGASDCFWDTQTSSQTTSAGGTGKTTAEMKILSTFTDSTWDFVGETTNGSDDYWGINSEENSGYPFLSWQSYTHAPISAPTTQATSIAFSDIGATSMTVRWTRGNGDSCAVFLIQASTGAASPVDDAYYGADSVYASGDQIGTSGWYAVYRGTDTTVTITGLSDNTAYRAHVCEFNTGSTFYNSNSSTGNPANQTTVLAVPEIDVQGNYVSIANGDDSPSLADHTDFDSVSVSFGTQQRTYTIHNTGSGTLYLGPVKSENNAATSSIEIPNNFVTITGENSGDFEVTTQPGFSVTAGDSTTFVVEFDPSAMGQRSAVVNIMNNDSDENPFTFTIQGVGTAPEIDVRGNYITIADGDTTPSVEDSTSFGSAAVDDGTIDRTFRIFNTGNEVLSIAPDKSSDGINQLSLREPTIGNFIHINGAHADDFTVTDQPDDYLIQPGDSVSFTVQFNPSAGGTRTANVYIYNNDADENLYNYYVSGVGITPPTLTTAALDSITVISAVGGGNVTADGGDSVTARGVCWGLTENPTVDSSHTSDGTGTGEFTSSLTGLAHGATYHVRAYATNSAGTGYGADSTFTTEQIIITTSPSDTLLKGGQEVTYTVSVANVLPAMRGFSVQVDFDDDHFTSPSFTEGTYLSSVGTTQWDASGSDGSYIVDCAILGTTDGQTGDGALFTIQLTTADAVADSIVDPESANLALSNVTLRDVDNAAITCDQSNGATIVIDTAPPTMETIAETDSVWYRSGPTLSNFGFDDNYALETVGYKVNDGDWDVISDDITGTEYNNDGISLPTYSTLAERTAVHTIYFCAVDDALNRAGYDDDSWHFSFYKDETAPSGALALSFSDVTTTGMNVVSAAFEDAVQGEEYYQFDCTTSDTYDRARTIADSIHECSGMTPNTQYTFKYQVSDGVADPNETPAWNATSWSSDYSKYTLSVAPTTSTVTCDKSGTISTTTLTFTAVGGFGAGKVEYYRYVLDDSATHTWTGSETQWSSGTVQLGIPTANTNYYLHVKGYNAEDVANGTLALGPYQWDGTPISPVTSLNMQARNNHGNAMNFNWTNPQHDAHYIEVWVKGFGGYPQYTGEVPAFPTTPAEASGNNWVKIQDSLATQCRHTAQARDFYYCAVFVEDLANHYSAATIDSSLSYWLGDINDTPDGEVDASDIAILASAYQTSSGDGNWSAVCDVGPTLDYGRISRPVPDDLVNFEDLMVFAMNYENTGDDEEKSDKSNSKTMINPIALKLNIQKVGTQFVAQLQLDENDGFVKGLYVPITFGTDLSFNLVRQGNLVSGSDFFDARQEGNTVYISAAALENGGVFNGNGVIAEILFTVSGVNSAIQFGDATARTASNADIELTFNYTDVALLTEGLIPTEYKLHQNYPNPFNPSTTIMYDLKESGRVKISLFNINGQRIATVLDQVKDAGYHSFVYEAGNLPSGVYMYQIEVNDFRDVRKLVLMK